MGSSEVHIRRERGTEATQEALVIAFQTFLRKHGKGFTVAARAGSKRT